MEWHAGFAAAKEALMAAKSWASPGMAAHAFRAAHCGEKIIPCDIVFDFGLSGVTFLTNADLGISLHISEQNLLPTKQGPRAEPRRGGRFVDASIALGSF